MRKVKVNRKKNAINNTPLIIRNPSGFYTQPTPKKAEEFSQHRFENKVESIRGGLPKIVISKKAMDKMYHYVDIASQEIGWFGTVKESENNFFIDDVFLFEQVVSYTETASTQDGLIKFAEEIMEKYNKPADILNSIKFWGHSHVNMQVFPSGQDDRQMEELRDADHPWFIRAILNKQGDMKFDIYFYEGNFRINDVPWKIHHEIDENLHDEIDNEIDRKVSSGPSYFNNYQGIPGNTVYHYNEFGDLVSGPGKPVENKVDNDIVPWYNQIPGEEANITGDVQEIEDYELSTEDIDELVNDNEGVEYID